MVQTKEKLPKQITCLGNVPPLQGGGRRRRMRDKTVSSTVY